jgi:hypothetical protein
LNARMNGLVFLFLQISSRFHHCWNNKVANIPGFNAIQFNRQITFRAASAVEGLSAGRDRIAVSRFNPFNNSCRNEF